MTKSLVWHDMKQAEEHGERTRAAQVPGGIIIARDVFQYAESAVPATSMVFVPGVRLLYVNKQWEMAHEPH